jgi:hypothetical protein
MKKCAALLTTIALTACAERGTVVTTVDTLCIATTRYRATDAQVAAFKADRSLWEPLVDWLLAFDKQRDKACLKPMASLGARHVDDAHGHRWDRAAPWRSSHELERHRSGAVPAEGAG